MAQLRSSTHRGSFYHAPGNEKFAAQDGGRCGPARARVAVPFVCGCGRCEYCLAGQAQVCPNQTQPGFTGPGSFAELVAIHAAKANLVSLPASVDFVTAASLGCRFA